MHHLRSFARRPGILFSAESRVSTCKTRSLRRPHEQQTRDASSRHPQLTLSSTTSPSSKSSRDSPTISPTRSSSSPSSSTPPSLLPPHPSNSILTSLKTTLGFAHPHPISASYKSPPFNGLTNPYRAKKRWPPNFEALSPRHKFHFEKTYRRRAKLKYTRPGWDRLVKLVRNGLVVAVIVYWVFWLEVEDFASIGGIVPGVKGQDGGDEGSEDKVRGASKDGSAIGTPAEGLRRWLGEMVGVAIGGEDAKPQHRSTDIIPTKK